jgi:hypothetical protein
LMPLRHNYPMLSHINRKLDLGSLDFPVDTCTFVASDVSM